MAKLYWRVKDSETGKWKWVAATRKNTTNLIRCCELYEFEYAKGDSK